MRITFLNDGFRNCGGCLQLVKYANILAMMGHDVRLAYEVYFDFDMVPVRIPRFFTPALNPRDTPDADAILCSSWHMAEKMARLPASKGEKFQYVQDFENWSGATEAIVASWRAPTHKIVVASYLEEMVRVHTGCRAERIPYGVDLETLYPGQRRPPGPELVVGALYNSMPRKRFHDVVAAVEMLRRRGHDVRLEVFGAEPAPSLPQPARYTRLPSPEEKRALFNRCHVWLALSEQEGLHIPPMEAMACGTPLITTDIGGMRDYCLHERTGLRVSVGKASEVCDALERLLREPELWRQLSQEALEHVRAMGSEQDNVARMARFMEARIAERDRGRPALFDFAAHSRDTWATVDAYAHCAAQLLTHGEHALAADLATGVLDYVDERRRAGENPRVLAGREPMEGLARHVRSLVRRDPQPDDALERVFALDPDNEDALDALAAQAGLELEHVHRNPVVFDGFLRLYPTLQCNLRCEYCVNAQPPGARTDAPRIAAEAWAEAINAVGRHVILTGGEPFLHPGLVTMVNAIDPRLMVRIYSNFSMDLRRRLEAFTREVWFFASWHPTAGADRDIFLANMAHVQANPMLSAVAHAIETPGAARVLEDDRAAFRERGVHLVVDRDQRGFVGSQGPPREAYCRKRIILVGPDGMRYPCVSRLVRRQEPLENFLVDGVSGGASFIRCQDFGHCAPCDALGETRMSLIRKSLGANA